ncbi:MAG: cytidylate kinase family protein [Deltaproteobacteria bacterium]|nr:cytidylate kinase family protein [Deltaproteobacteria bacterium]
MPIITISREMGTGGIPIAQKAAEKLGYTLLDGETIEKAAKNYGLTPESIKKADEKPPPFEAKLDKQVEFDLLQIELLVLDFALKGNVIIYGRGGQYLLENIKSVLRVRIIAPFEERVERWAEREWLDPDLARTMVRKCDQQRAGFIKYYFDREWDNPLDYDIVINTSRIALETAVGWICQGVKDLNLLGLKAESKALIADLIIQKKIEIANLSHPGLDGHHLEVSSKNGIVTLGGHVHSEEEHAQVLALTEGVEGIKKIIDKIKLKPFRYSPYEP